MKVGVIGAGAIGGILSAHLIEAGHDVAVIDTHEPILANIRAEGLKITGPATAQIRGDFCVNVSHADHGIESAGPLDAIFVCTKATAIKHVSESIKKHWKKGTVIVSFQNGIDTEEVLAEVAGKDNTLRVVVNFAGKIIGPSVYSVGWFSPPNYIGALTEKGRTSAKEIADILNDSGLTTKLVDDVKKYAFEKTALNSTLCPLCALTGLTMGEAMAESHVRRVVVAILEEAFLIAKEMGWKFEKTLDEYLSYLEAGGKHKPSMMEDINARRKTEIEYMNSKICEHGERLGIATPYNDAMRAAIIGMEKSFDIQQAL